MRKKTFILTCIMILFCSSCNKSENEKEKTSDYTQYVNGFIGNADNGHTFPGACYPFGMVQASPESGVGSWRYCSGYNYDDDYIEGFSQTHLNGTGVPDLGDVLLLPFSGTAGQFKSRYDRNTHKSTAGYYAVKLTDFDVDVELTATAHTAFHRYTYNTNNEKQLYVDLQRGLVSSPQKIHTRVLDAEIDWVDSQTIVGSQEVEAWVRRRYYYIIKFDKPCVAKKELIAAEGERSKRYVLAFNLKEGEALQVKIALSGVSLTGAIAAMEKEIPDWDFDEVRCHVQAEWNRLLSRVQIEGTMSEKVNFYTSLYHLCIQPNNIADIDGHYRGVNDSVYYSSTGTYYSTLSLWDTYRAAHPLYTILIPEKVGDFVKSMLVHHDVQGFLPVWTLWGKENFCMVGNHAIPVIVDACLKGVKEIDLEAAYQAVKESSMNSHENSDWDIYLKYGYYPFDLVQNESVSRTLESCYDDYCVACLAKYLGKEEDYAYFIRRADFYKNLLDPETRLMRGKDSNGHWRAPFNPFSLSHAASHGGDYTEGNAWQYTWHVQHDIKGLIELMGGKETFVTKLDSLFFLDTCGESGGFVSDVTGLIGQYAHGNEPSHHVAYLYCYADRPDKTQTLIREIFDRFYLPKPDGLCGNDDCGQMSAWYIFSAMGFYPVNPVGGEYILGAPQVEKATLMLPDNKEFVMEAKGLSVKNKYVKAVFLNGKPLYGWKISHQDIMDGGRLTFEMTEQPQKK